MTDEQKSSSYAVDAEGLHNLFRRCEATFPAAYREKCWYLTAAASLLSLNLPSTFGSLYTFVLEDTPLPDPESRRQFVRRLRETLIKCIILVGIPKVMLAFHSLAAVESEEDQEGTFTREGWKPDDANRERGEKVLDVIYQGFQHKAHAACGSHKDVEWISTNISYGLFLADHQVMDIKESELVILPAIMCQDLKAPTDWHLKGCLRVGFTREEIDAVQKVIKDIAKYAGTELKNVGTIWDIPDDA
ncbi:hypothetical protein KVT40_003598 [Elsinoe batatas]|uniref:Uncharacterized protein n=1 Tax=Elsinoe batatas TaxID=2601811 RepID=A0A8K0L2G8_9PEZI|nr:hypothetical protein KVT40_003598 [Elsinoe batatas]